MLNKLYWVKPRRPSLAVHRVVPRDAGTASLIAGGLERQQWAPVLILFSAALPLLVGQALMPFEEFVHRSDDAYYYFKLAANFPRLGYWSFDGVEASNGVQPLWAVLLTSVAQLAAWTGVTHVYVLDRIFVVFTALVQFAAAMVLFDLLARQVSVGTGLAAAGAFLFPLGMVWGRLWGLESPLVALTLVSTASYYHRSFRPRPSAAGAAILGALLGLVCLSRLNAGLFIPCLLAYHLLSRSAGTVAERFRHVLVAGGVATAVVAPYLAWNVVHTGHVLPVSGVVKAIGVEKAFAEWGVETRWSWSFLSAVFSHWYARAAWFISSRLLDGMWLAGVRLVQHEALLWQPVLALVVALSLGPTLLGRPREWFEFLARRFHCLAPFSYFLFFAVLDAVVAVWMFPTQTYAIPRWWLVSSEILLVTLSATLTAAAVGFIGQRLVSARLRATVATAALALLIVAHARQTIGFYWDGRVEQYDWNLSWNDASYDAALWINRNVPKGELVGSWNAGALGYYTDRNVVNLDGLINNFAFLPYLRGDRVHEYVRLRNVRYISDMDRQIQSELRGRLPLTEVYRRYSPLMRADYRIYRIGM
jgi:hypothetical protein